LTAYIDGSVWRFVFAAFDVDHAGHDGRVLVQNLDLQVIHLKRISGDGAGFDELRVFLFS